MTLATLEKSLYRVNTSAISIFFEFLYRFGDETLVVHLCDYSIGGTSLLFV